MTSVRIAAAQTPAYREDIEAALQCLVDETARAAAQGAVLLCFPECFLQGYLTDAAAARRSALDLVSPAFEDLLQRFPKTGPMIVVGLIEIDDGRLFNTAVVIDRGVMMGRYQKTHLLASECIFTAGHEGAAFETHGLRFGINICYDTNFASCARTVAALDASLIVCPANNMLPRKTAETLKDVHNTVRGQGCQETGLWLMSADVTGEHADMVSWGPTAVLDPGGKVAAQLPLEKRGLLVFDLPYR